MSEKEMEALKRSDELHNQAMNVSFHADLAKTEKDFYKMRQLYSQAFDLEKEAAQARGEVAGDELWRAVLFRSAAWLAFLSDRYLDAVDMAHEGLSGNPPEEIEIELYDVLEQTVAKMTSRHRQEMKVAA